jgi:hypothetical protein
MLKPQARFQARRYLWSLLVAFVLTLVITAIDTVMPDSIVGTLLAPGMLAAAISFPQGAHSDLAIAYLLVAEVLNVFFLSWVVLGVWTVINRLR